MIDEDLDDLTMFMGWWLTSKPLMPPHEGEVMRASTNATATVLYVQAPYHVELVTLHPNSKVPDHTHPDSDRYQVYLSGDIEFSVDGHVRNPEPKTGDVLRVFPNTVHGVHVGPRGGAFISIQKHL